MPAPNDGVADSWPPLAYRDFAPTQYLLHMALQAIGKLKLHEPFQPQWCGVPLWVNARGLTTGAIPYAGGAYEIRVDLIAHEVACVTTWDFSGRFALGPTSVAGFVSALFDLLDRAGVRVSIDLDPCEVTNPVPFDRDTEPRPYERALVNNWWRILLSTQRVMQVFDGRFQGKTQPIGLMWGTLDIRDAFYNGKPAVPEANADYIRRNAMNAEVVEIGWWAGNAAYPKPAFYSFAYPQPAGVENARIGPPHARWDPAMGEFLLDYEALRESKTPDDDLLSFFESTYRAVSECAGWDADLIGTGRPE